jgi:hypothetical protein
MAKALHLKDFKIQENVSLNLIKNPMVNYLKDKTILLPYP